MCKMWRQLAEPNADKSLDIPLADCVVRRCLLDLQFFGLQFFEEPDGELLIRLEGGFRIKDSAEITWETDGTMPGVMPASSLLGKIVRRATALPNGSLVIHFDDGTELVAPPDQQFEAWEVRAHGRFLIVSTPGGNLAVWR